MSQNVLFLRRENGDVFAMLNLSQFVYIDGSEETEEHPSGSRSRVFLHNGPIEIGLPFEQLKAEIEKQIKQNYEYEMKVYEARRKQQLTASADMMKQVMREFSDHHD